MITAGKAYLKALHGKCSLVKNILLEIMEPGTFKCSVPHLNSNRYHLRFVLVVDNVCYFN